MLSGREPGARLRRRQSAIARKKRSRRKMFVAAITATTITLSTNPVNLTRLNHPHDTGRVPRKLQFLTKMQARTAPTRPRREIVPSRRAGRESDQPRPQPVARMTDEIAGNRRVMSRWQHNDILAELPMPDEGHMPNLRPGIVHAIIDRVIPTVNCRDEPGKHIKKHAGQRQSANHCQPTNIFHGNSKQPCMPGFDPKRECNVIHTPTRKLGIIVIPGGMNTPCANGISFS